MMRSSGWLGWAWWPTTPRYAPSPEAREWVEHVHPLIKALPNKKPQAVADWCITALGGSKRTW